MANTVPAPSALTALMAESFAPQRAFTYNKEIWHRWLGHLPEVSRLLNDLPGQVDRSIATGVVGRNWSDNPAGAFTAAMVWGHGATGYGPYRVAKILTQSSSPRDAKLNSSVVEKLVESVRVVREEGPGKGFYYMNNDGRILGLASAFFTKWLYFGSAFDMSPDRTAAPVLDALVLGWLRSEGVKLRPGRTPDYEKYVAILESWGTPHGLTPVDVEERIFRLLRNDG